jgi:hypothetical protein
MGLVLPTGEAAETVVALLAAAGDGPG